MEIEGTPRALAFFLFVDLAKVGGLRKSMNLRGQRKGGKKEKRSCRLKHSFSTPLETRNSCFSSS